MATGPVPALQRLVRDRRVWWGGAGALASVAAVIALIAAARSPRSAKAEAEAVAARSRPAAAKPTGATTPPPPAQPAAVEVAFRSTPSGATVFRDGSDTALGVTPFTTQLNATAQPQSFAFRRPGSKEGRATVSLETNALVEVALAPQDGEDEAGRDPGTTPKRARGGHRRKNVKLDQSTVLNPFE